ncbi:HAD-IB family hydrolase [Streptomyces sanglieri]|uniref:HAD-IB family hydrolase n=1 Tax=Streptomyces sanglieri TaxID=193460 RepID=A0ABW2X2H6_9ACTN|nr:HAD-IB family hydrolase [Streptomyces sp. Wh19]MDV9198109.1 HAD-IB family hydrolase [Streptomyces sp. Wh19]
MRDPRIAFFDVDETLVAAKSMLSFWNFWQHESGAGKPGRPAPIPLERLLELPREEANRAYYRYFAGVRRTELLAAGRRWYRAARDTDAVFLPETLDRLRLHQRQGFRIVLVSGSLRACVDPIAEAVGADRVLCTEQAVTRDGVLTGGLIRAMIGSAKARAVAEVLDAWNADAGNCYAYGDHPSDLPMLRAVGHPVVVGQHRQHSELATIALTEGWPTLPAAPAGDRRPVAAVRAGHR